MTAFQKILATLSFIFIADLIWLFITSLMVADPGITAAVIAVLGAIAGTLYTHAQTSKREIKARHFIEKKTAYSSFIGLLYDCVESEKSKKKIKNVELEEKILNFKKELMVWGGQEVFKALDKYERFSVADPKEHEILLLVDNLLRAIRKDLGHDDSRIIPGELVSTFIIAEEREKLFAPDP